MMKGPTIRTETTRLKHRMDEPQTVTLTWYRATEDLPMTCGAVLNEYGHKVHWRNSRWEALGTDGGYFEVNPPTWWCYIPTAPWPRM